MSDAALGNVFPGESGNRAALAISAREPNTDSERYMAALWKEVVGVGRVSLEDKFIDVGGNSLTLTIVLARIEEEKSVAMDPQLFFIEESSSLENLARELDQLREVAAARAYT